MALTLNKYCELTAYSLEECKVLWNNSDEECEVMGELVHIIIDADLGIDMWVDAEDLEIVEAIEDPPIIRVKFKETHVW